MDSPVQKLKLAEWEAPEPVVVELFAPGVVNSLPGLNLAFLLLPQEIRHILIEL